MATKKLVDLSPLGVSPATGDLFLITDISDTTDAATGTSKKVTYGDLLSGVTITESQISDLQNYLVASDISSLISLTNLSVGAEGSASGNGNLAYNNATGVFTYTPPTIAGLNGSINDLNDVTLSSTASNDVLSWNGSAFVNTDALTLDSLQFDLTAAETPAVGKLSWNSEDLTLDLGLDADVTLQIGQEQVVRVKANTAIRNGMGVYSGAPVGGSDNLTISPFSATAGGVEELYFLGIATQEFDANEVGFATTFGKVRGVNGNTYASGGIRDNADTTDWEVGDILYCSPNIAGALTSIIPIAPDRRMPVAFVLKAASQTNITLFVRAESGLHLSEIHNVHIYGTVDDNELLAYDTTTSSWRNQTAAEAGLASTSDISTFISLTNLSVGAEGIASGDGSLTYNNTTGVFTYTPPTAAGIGAALTSHTHAASDTISGTFSDARISLSSITQHLSISTLTKSGYGALTFDSNTGVFSFTPSDKNIIDNWTINGSNLIYNNAANASITGSDLAAPGTTKNLTIQTGSIGSNADELQQNGGASGNIQIVTGNINDDYNGLANSGTILLQTGDNSTNGNTGNIQIFTGDSISANSGDLTLGTGNSGSLAGDIILQPGDDSGAYTKGDVRPNIDYSVDEYGIHGIKLGTESHRWSEIHGARYYGNILVFYEQDSVNDIDVGSAQPGEGVLYVKNDGKIYFQNDSGTEYDLTASGGGTVTSVATTVPTGFTISGSPITTSGTLAIGFDTGYSLPTTSDQTNWDTAYGWGNHASAGYITDTSTSTLSNKTFSDNITVAEIAAPSTPANGYGTVYAKTDGKLYFKNDSGTEYDLTAAGGGGSGTVTSVDMTVPTGFAISGNPITTSGTLALTFDTGYSLPTTSDQTNWDTAYGWGNHASAGYASINLSFNDQTGTTYTLVLGDASYTVVMNNASANTLTVPANASVAFPIGTQLAIVQKGAGQTTISPASGVTISAPGGASKLAGQNSVATLIKYATDTWYLFGDLESTGSSLILDDLSDVTITSNSAGEILKWSGSAWINNTLAEAGISATGHTHAASDITSGTLVHERGGLEADVSAYSGLLKITGGATSAVTAPTGTIVGTSDSQTLTNKTISADDNTLSGIAASSFVLSNASGYIDGTAAQKAIPSGTVVGTTDTQTLTNKTISASSNTITNIGSSEITTTIITGLTEKTTPVTGDYILGYDTTGTALKKFDVGNLPSSGSSAITFNDQTGASYTLALSDVDNAVTMSYSSSNTVTVPPNASVAFAVGDQITIIQKGAGQTLISPGSGVTLLSPGNAAYLADTNSVATLIKYATNTWLLFGDLETSGGAAAGTPIEMVIAASDETTALTTGTSKVTVRAPAAFTLNSVRASLSTAQTSGNILTVDINEGGVSVLGTKLTIDNTEKTSTTAATAATITDSNIADDAEITIDIDQVGDGTAKGLKVTLIGIRT